VLRVIEPVFALIPVSTMLAMFRFIKVRSGITSLAIALIFLNRSLESVWRACIPFCRTALRRKGLNALHLVRHIDPSTPLVSTGFLSTASNLTPPTNPSSNILPPPA
jgi:hypothetical protein